MNKTSRIFRLLTAVMTAAAVLFLTSCSLVNELAFRLGFDTHDYEGESVIATHQPDSEAAIRLADMTHVLSINKPVIPTFSKSSEAAELYRDSILNYMLSTGYAKYTGNIELLDRAAAEYGQLKIAAVIPADDFNNTVYQYFGGSAKVKNKSGAIFSYLPKVDAYTCAGHAQEYSMVVAVTRCEETENTYRLEFTISSGTSISPKYRALLVKREDGTCWFKSIAQI